MSSAFLRCEIVGIEDMRSALEQIGDVMRKQVVRGALARSLAPVAEEARRLAPVGTDDAEAAVARLVVTALKGTRKALRAKAAKELSLRDSVIVTTSLSASQQRRRVREPREFEAFVSSTAPHAHLVEFGHALVKARTIGQAVRRRRGKLRVVDVVEKRTIGHVAARPFLRPAFDARRELVLTTFGEELRKGLERTANRLYRQAEAGTLSRAGRVALRIGGR